jgi:mannose-6-phosphate isomerase-like protein (cupin superfamily)
MVKNQSRRRFLQTAPIAAAASLTLTNELVAQAPPSGAPVPFKSFTAEQIATATKALDAKPGDNNLFIEPSLPLTVVLTEEVAKSAKEFEWHEGRDHVVQILEGSTLYEVGGTPEGAHSSKPGEWNAPTAKGTKSIIMGKGDMLVIPRNTLHKRSTEDRVVFTLISSPGVVKA